MKTIKLTSAERETINKVISNVSVDVWQFERVVEETPNYIIERVTLQPHCRGMDKRQALLEHDRKERRKLLVYLLLLDLLET